MTLMEKISDAIINKDFNGIGQLINQYKHENNTERLNNSLHYILMSCMHTNSYDMFEVLIN